jgi:pyruvate/2-oxoglutarate dehydrogenase complex dihydrolipoamide dehydrogenase (E3) component
LAEVPYLTNETLFSLKEQPAHLAIIGGGPIGIEMAQAFRRLGSKVTVFEGASRILARDDPTLTTLLYDQLKAEGVTFHTGLFVDRITPATSGLDLHFNTDGHTQVLSASHLLVAAGRTPNIEQLGLPAADIKHGKTGIQVNGQLRTSNPRVYAVGDVAGPYLFTHMAAEQATLFIKRVLFGNVLAKGQPTPVPWVTYTDPELAHIGLTWEEAQRKYGNKLGITELATAEVDRYVAERRTEGKIRVFTAPGGKVVGVNILAAQAGELLPVWGLIIQQGLKLSALSSVIHPYPTMGELNKRIASKYYSGMLYAPRTGRLSRLLFRLLG